MEEKKELNFIKVLRFLVRWRYSILITTLVGGVAGAIFSAPFFITPLYQSSATFFAGTEHSSARALLERSDLTRPDFLEFGKEDEAEDMLQILESDYVMNVMIEKFDLMNRYGVDPDNKYARTELEDIYHSRTTFSRTPYASVYITVKDADPHVAAEMANTFMYMSDTVKDNIQRRRAEDAYDIMVKEYELKLEQVNNMIDSLQNMAPDLPDGFGNAANPSELQWQKIMQSLQQMKSGMHNQASVTTAGLNNYAGNWTEVMHNMGMTAFNQVQQNNPGLMDQSRILHHYGPAFYALAQSLSHEIETLSYLRESKENFRVDAQEHMTHLFVIDEARPADRKAEPVRTVIAIGSAIFGFLIACLVLLILENYRRIRQFITDSSVRD